jgi:hypothetical protein
MPISAGIADTDCLLFAAGHRLGGRGIRHAPCLDGSPIEIRNATRISAADNMVTPVVVITTAQLIRSDMYHRIPMRHIHRRGLTKTRFGETGKCNLDAVLE